MKKKQSVATSAHEILSSGPKNEYGVHNQDGQIPLAVLPLKNVILLPRSILPIIVGREFSINAVEKALQEDKTIFITTQKDPELEQPGFDDIFWYGVRSTILQVMRMPNGALKILAEGLCRAEITTPVPHGNYLQALCSDIPTQDLENTTDLMAAWRHLCRLYEQHIRLNERMPANILSVSATPLEMDTLVDTLAVHMNLSLNERLSILQSPSLPERTNQLINILSKENEILETEQRIKGRVQSQVEKNQREYYLTEQIKAIHKELGHEDLQSELENIKSRAKKIGLSKEASDKVAKEVRRLEQMPPMSPEGTVTRNYIDWILALPWKEASQDTISIEKAEEILNNTHAGLKKPKERIIEFIAAKKFSKNLRRAPIICLVGPPGVGKTSLAKSIADSMGREFVRISLGGVRDEAEIRGHRRTYIGALPGKIIQAMKKAKTINPVILLDEIDKISRDFHGDPASALLEVLDPEQNKSFVDHYLEVEYDLSQVMFVTTANMIETIPHPLFDRMEIITLSGYTEPEKMKIARDFLIPRGLKEYGLTKTQFILSDELLKSIIENYTKESGVRQLERVMTKLMRKVIQELLHAKTKKSVAITEAQVLEWLGHSKYRRTSLDSARDRVGLATGLAWTEVGGDVLEIETTVLPGKGGMTLTGQLGDVMQESAQAALSYIRSRAQDLGLPVSFYASKDIHVHIPEGATPKDGPSAGITMCAALVSALCKIPTKNDVAMTGEITLRGRVLSIGGLKEKLLAAKQHAMKTVLLPFENKDDLEDVPKDIKEGLTLVLVKHMDEVLAHALTKNPLSKKKTTSSAKKNGGKKKNTSEE